MTMSHTTLTDSWDSDQGNDEYNIYHKFDIIHKYKKAFGAAKDDYALVTTTLC